MSTSTLLGNLVVDLCVASEVYDGEVRQLAVTLKSVLALSNPVSFITTADLLPEIWVKAGLPVNPSVTLIALVDSRIEGTLHVYDLTISKQETA